MQVITTKNTPADIYLWLKLVKILQVEACVLIDDFRNNNSLSKNYI